MDNKNKKNVLIVGSDATAHTLALQMSELDNVSQIYVAAGNDAIKECAKVVDIRETNPKELLEFALENAIDLTIVTSEDAVKEDVSTLFSKNGQLIFCPSKDAAGIALNKAIGKKFMYKNHIPCPHFGIFDKQANDYLEKANYPVVVKSETHQKNGVLICNTVKLAKNYIDELFTSGENKILVEDYIFGHEFSFYVITDGYHALELGCVATYKYELEGNGGLLSSGMGAIADDYTITNPIKNRIMNSIIYPTLKSLSNSQKPYVGILGVDLVIDPQGNLYVIEFNPFLKAPDSQCILPLINQNLYDLFEACAIGSFADDYEYIDIENSSSAACVVCANKQDEVIEGLDRVEENTHIAHFNTRKNSTDAFETPKGRTLVLARKAKVLSRAVSELYQDLDVIKFDGIRYRKDIGKII